MIDVVIGLKFLRVELETGLSWLKMEVSRLETRKGDARMKVRVMRRARREV